MATPKKDTKTTRKNAASSRKKPGTEIVNTSASRLTKDTSNPGYAPPAPISLDSSGNGSLFTGERKYAEIDEVTAEDISEGLKSDSRNLDLAHQRADNAIKEQGLIVKANKFEAGQEKIKQSQQSIRTEIARTAEVTANAETAETKAGTAEINRKIATAENITVKAQAELRLAELDKALEKARKKQQAYQAQRQIQDTELARLKGEL